MPQGMRVQLPPCPQKLKMAKIKLCKDCGPLPVNHLENWVNDFLRLGTTPDILNWLPIQFFNFLDQSIYQIFLWLKLFSVTEKIDDSKISLRTLVFIAEAKKRGIAVKSLSSWSGPTNHFEMAIRNKKYYFEGLPRAEHLENQLSKIIDDKMAVKTKLQKAGLPVAEGRSFWWFQKDQAKTLMRKIGFPVVVKPRLGSMSQHITVNIKNEPDLYKAIKIAKKYSPVFIIEKFLGGVPTYRATVIDFQQVACVQRIPANVIGDGHRTIRELIDLKNSDPRRGQPRQKNTISYKIVTDKTVEAFLTKKDFSYKSILAKGERVYLQEKINVDFGGDLREETAKIHPDNLELFRKAAKLFNVRLVGIDFLIKDISLSWKSNPSAILELNSLPYIDMHHFPTDGQGINVASYLCEMVKKYY